ncbi:hypothetical protein HOLleu_11855 [Holothuria leucospilota]|uniref:OTU domain-containing protein n=1 Tax=Holothuria leucospilota TaxID=206669 RepID=A0A9Q1C9C1_HOLLE|nr:hypothetical protein HOLleu_11855 [Holothuria leucospilota]
MPKTKRKSHQQRKTLIKKSVQHLRQMKVSPSGKVEKEQILEHDSNHRGHNSQVHLVNIENNQLLHFFPVDSTWANAVAETLGLDNIPQSHTTKATSYISSPLTSTITASPSAIHRIQGDGNCFFRSLSYLILESEAKHHIFRDLTVKAIQKNHLPSKALTVQQYIQTSKMSHNNTWATEVEILAAASLLQTDIYVFALSGHHWKWLRYPQSGSLSTEVNSTKRAIYLVNTNSDHYDIVHSINCPTKTTQQLIEEELQRQCIWQQQKIVQHPDNMCRMRKLRASSRKYQAKERAQNLERIRNLRSNDKFHMQEVQNNAKRMKNTRSIPAYSHKERQNNITRIQNLRSNESYSQKENKKNVRRMKKIRATETYSQNEKQHNLTRMKIMRANEIYSQKEKQNNLSRMKTIRANETYSKNEKQHNLTRIKSTKTNEIYSQKEKQHNLKRMKITRANDIYSQKEKQNNKSRIKTIRANKAYSRKEREQNKSRTKRIRAGKTFAQKESEINVSCMYKMQSKETYAERERYMNKKRMQSLRAVKQSHQKEKLQNQKHM